MSSPKYTPPPPVYPDPPPPKPIMGNKSDLESTTDGNGATPRTKRKGSRNDLVIDLAPGVGSSTGLNIPT